MRTEITKGLICASLLLILTACGGDSTIPVKEGIVTEYGSELKVEDLTDQEGVSLKEIKDFDNMKIGEQTITAIFTDTDDKEIEQKITLEVKDTKAPEITFKSDTVEITLGDEFDTTSNIESVKDVIDGDIAHSTDNMITADGYYFDGDVKAEVGEYTINVIAFDKNGNKAEKSFKVIIKEKEESESQNQSIASNQGGASKPQTSSQSGGNSQSSSGNSGNNASGGSSAQPSTPKVVCPNGNEPAEPNLPCDALRSYTNPNAYRDASGNVVTFPTAEAATTWAWDVLKNDPTFTRVYGYKRYVTLPTSRNDGTECHIVIFEK